MPAHSYDIPEAFTYDWTTPEGSVSGAFAAGPTGDLTDDEAAYLAAVAVPAGFAVDLAQPAPAPDPAPVDSLPIVPDPQPDPAADPTPQEQPQ